MSLLVIAPAKIRAARTTTLPRRSGPLVRPTDSFNADSRRRGLRFIARHFGDAEPVKWSCQAARCPTSSTMTTSK